MRVSHGSYNSSKTIQPFVQSGRKHFYKDCGEDGLAKYGETKKIWTKYEENTLKYWKTYSSSSRRNSSISATKIGFFFTYIESRLVVQHTGKDGTGFGVVELKIY